MVVSRNNGVVGLTGFSDKKMNGLLFGPQKSGRNSGVVVWQGSTVLAKLVLPNEDFGKFFQAPTIVLGNSTSERKIYEIFTFAFGWKRIIFGKPRSQGLLRFQDGDCSPAAILKAE